MSQILIIEDEIKAAKELRRMLEDTYPEAKIMGILSSVEESIEWLNQHPSPDLIFSDIQLADGLSFDIFKAVKIQAPVIFCTAFDEYAIRAFETNGIDYLLKPIDKERLQQGLSKLNTLKNAFKAPNTPLENLLSVLKPSHKSTLLVYFKDKILPIKAHEIAFFYYENGTLAAYTHKNLRYQLHYSLDDLENQLDSQMFYRANRQFIVHKEAIISVEQYFARKLVLKLSLTTPETVVVSKAKASHFLRWMEQ